MISSSFWTFLLRETVRTENKDPFRFCYVEKARNGTKIKIVAYQPVYYIGNSYFLVEIRQYTAVHKNVVRIQYTKRQRHLLVSGDAMNQKFSPLIVTLARPLLHTPQTASRT